MFPTLQRRGHRVMATTVAMATAILIAVGVTGATADSKTTSVAITPLTPVRTVTAGVSIAAGKTYAFVGSGGSTTVPTNALVIRLAITVKGAAGGTLSFAPLGDPAGASPTKVTWPAGGTGSGTVNVNLGASNKVVVSNASTGSATVGVKITGYSTQVTAAGINGAGGTNGQVLTNNGDGTVAWKNTVQPPAIYKGAVTQTGVVLHGNFTATQTGSGQYTVTIDRPLADCAVTATPGLYPGASVASATSPLVTVSQTSSPTASIRFWNSAVSANASTSFYVLIVC